MRFTSRVSRSRTPRSRNVSGRSSSIRSRFPSEAHDSGTVICSLSVSGSGPVPPIQRLLNNVRDGTLHAIGVGEGRTVRCPQRHDPAFKATQRVSGEIENPNLATSKYSAADIDCQSSVVGRKARIKIVLRPSSYRRHVPNSPDPHEPSLPLGDATSVDELAVVG